MDILNLIKDSTKNIVEKIRTRHPKLRLFKTNNLTDGDFHHIIKY